MASATAKGDIQVTFSNDKQNKPVTLQNILYVPTLRMNLLSVAKIVDRKHQVLFTKNQESSPCICKGRLWKCKDGG